MRSKDTTLKNEIYDFVNCWKRNTGTSPSLKIIADRTNVSRTTVYRYLKEMSGEGGLEYYGEGIDTKELNGINMDLAPAMIVGSIPCGEAQSEEQYVEAYVNLPTVLFGKGEFYILRAKGDSMEDAGIAEGNLVVILRQPTAEVGDIVVALIDDSATVKTFYKENGHYRLQPENDTMDPIIVDQVEILGKVYGVFRFMR